MSYHDIYFITFIFFLELHLLSKYFNWNFELLSQKSPRDTRSGSYLMSIHDSGYWYLVIAVADDINVKEREN